LYNLSKTYTILIKDIPFVTNLSKYYDKDILNSKYGKRNLDNNRIDDLEYKKNNLAEDHQSVLAGIEEDSHITDNINSSNKYENREDNFEEAVRAQMNYDTDTTNSQEHLDCIKRLEELEN
jgi:hypothetical protein